MVSLLGRLCFTLLAATLLISAGASAAVPQPSVQGNRIVDSLTGERFVPHGVNFPGFEYACQQGWGYGGNGTEPDEMDLTAAAIASWKINTVRLPLNEDCWLGRNGLPSGGLTMSGYRQVVESFVAALNSAGLVAILDLHWSNPDGEVADGLRPMPDQGAPAFWTSVATRFKDYPSVIFDLFNEPHSRWNGNTKVFGLSWNCWAAGGCNAPAEPDTVPVSGHSWYKATGMKTLTARVRATGATQPIILSGIDYANDLRGWSDHAPDDGQLIAGFHNYPYQRCKTTLCWNEEIAPLAVRVPVLATEFGQNDCGPPGHMNHFMNWADDHLVGYLAWAWWVLPAQGCHNFALVSSLNGTPLAPAGTALHDHLASLPDVLPEPPEPIAPGLSIRKATWNGRTLQLRVKVNTKARKAVRAKVRMVRDRRVARKPRARARLIERRLKAVSGIAKARIRIPRGLKPSLVTVTYPGDSALKAGKARRKPSSVTRKRSTA
ncbi:MAG: cellulase family glycosylhydrolase [Solirubrobacterales bacterium]|nr:cellulase family glycosylhydrolase [Solirubrobacterales bacterium]